MNPGLLVIDTGLADPRRNVALTAALIEAHVRGEIPDTLRLHRYQKCVLIGRSQDAETVLDAAACRRRGAAIVRRVTGGGAVAMARSRRSAAARRAASFWCSSSAVLAARAAASSAARQVAMAFSVMRYPGGVAEESGSRTHQRPSHGPSRI